MPRGVYERKGKKYAPPGSNIPESLAREMCGVPKDEPPACSRCLAFEPDDAQYGLCRLYPQAVRQRADGWCMQFKGRKP